MELLDKLSILADAAKYDASCASSGSKRERAAGGIGNTEGMGICHSFTPDGRCVSLLKILLTNHCVYDCHYCVNRASSPVRRARMTPEEVVTLTLGFYERNYIEGLFLSSGIVRSPDSTMEELARVAEILRVEHKFGGYIHLKAVPGASPALLERAGRHADRLSANIELPTQADLDALAPAKSMVETEGTMAAIRERIDEARESPAPRIARAPRFAPAGQSTQLIVGATAATDAVLLGTADRLYRNHRLRRVYYTAYSPIPTATPGLPTAPPPLVREHRLYQADWLMRHYGFEAAELLPAGAPDLALDRDPKLAWALRNRAWFPVDVNTAPREALLRVPGFGVRTVDRILDARPHHALTLDDLRILRATVSRAAPFVIAHLPSTGELDGVGLERRLVGTQLSLFP